MPPEAKVFIIEDLETWQELISINLENAGHQIVGRARSRKEASEAIPRFKDFGVQVVTIDGNLSRGFQGGEDARVLIPEIRRIAPEVAIVGMSTSSVVDSDLDVGKPSLFMLADEITGI